MKWIPLSERKPEFKNCIQGKILFCTSKYAQNDDWNNFKSEFTHWLEFELPPLPNTKDNNRHYLDKNLYLIQSKLERLDESTEAGDAHLLNRIIDLENKFDNLEERHSNLLENFIKWICRFSKLIDKP